ncbi:MAG: DNA gyrase subunit A [Candidatus Sumerlaeia bacterium]|nr:DNA gyrase subunit A [Candidatus Sumerlaeia bacterium]
MDQISENISPIAIEDEMASSFLDYSMSVIVSRALPDVRDGLKPVHRRILYASYDRGFRSNRAPSKSAKIVGEVMGNFHPHGDSAIYDALVRMAQPWSMSAPLIDGQGNFGSVDGDPPAAMRYTEARMAATGEFLLTDIEKETVDFVPTYDGKELEPSVLPASFPNLLVNGSEGIAVGMATRIPPHSLSECIDALIMLIDNPQTTLEEILNVLPGPDFPTGGYILGREGIRDAYSTGRGRVIMRARCHTESLKSGKEAIIVDEIPYQVNKANLIRDIAEHVRDKKLTGITDIRDESDRDGMRIVIELKRGEESQVIINNLYKKTAMQTNYGVILLAIVNNRPRYLSLMRILHLYLQHRREVLLRGTRYDLNRAQDRLHIVEGLLIALADIEEVIRIIRSSPDTDTARARLMEKFLLSKRQTDAILEMRLRTLTALEVDKLKEEADQLQKLIAELESILASEKKQFSVIRADLLGVQKKFGQPRRTEIINNPGEMTVEDLIAEERMVVTISHKGYIKRTDTNLYRKQKRGGKGLKGADFKDDDWVEHLFVGTTHDYIMFFTNKGKAYWLKVWELPQAGRGSRGRPIVNLLEALEKDEKIESVVAVSEFSDEQFLLFITRKGQIQKNALSLYSNPRKGGIKALNIDDDDELVTVRMADDTQDILIGTRKGMAVRFGVGSLRSAGRFTTGVRGVNLEDGDYVIGMDALRPGCTIFTVSEKGMGKRSSVDDYRRTSRGTKGVINMKITERTGEIVSVSEVSDTDELMLMTGQGQTIRFKVSGIRVIGRNTQGVRLFNLGDNDRIVAVSGVGEDGEEDAELLAELGEDVEGAEEIGEETPEDNTEE